MDLQVLLTIVYMRFIEWDRHKEPVPWIQCK